jgi:hypothetical protein|eukprot:COSAG01_NODE_7678_length_3101_cov_3.712525_2_plen_41_part_00
MQVVQLIEQLISSEAVSVSQQDIGVICFYRKQVTFIHTAD